jgi:hypothetical protein
LKPEERSEGTVAWERARERRAEREKRVEGPRSILRIWRARKRDLRDGC